MADAGCNSPAGCQLPGAQLAECSLQSHTPVSLSTVQAALLLKWTGLMIFKRSVSSQKQQKKKDGEKKIGVKERKEKKTVIAISQRS